MHISKAELNKRGEGEGRKVSMEGREKERGGKGEGVGSRQVDKSQCSKITFWMRTSTF